MIKLRLHGTPEEIEAALSVVRAMPRFNVLSESHLYPDRPPSKHARCYIDIDLQPRQEGIDFDPETGEILT